MPFQIATINFITEFITEFNNRKSTVPVGRTNNELLMLKVEQE